MRHDIDLENRRFVIIGLVLAVILVFIIRLFYLQIVSDEYIEKAKNNAFQVRTIYPSRGIIYDRKGRELVYNQPAYDVMVTMKEVKNLDTLDFCNVLGITREAFEKRMRDITRSRGFSYFTQQVFVSQLTAKDFAKVEEALYRFKGFDTRIRTIRQYKYPIAPLILGNIGEVGKKMIEKDSYYTQGDWVGNLGVEKYYETILRGKKGKEYLLRDVKGRIKEHYDNGSKDVAPVAGHDITLTIDAELQQYAESLMVNKIGALVAIEPSTGEVLAMVSSPTFDPRLLAGRDRGKNYTALFHNPYHPLNDRAIQASYPPGSTFKPAQALIALEDGALTPNTVLPCHGGFRQGKFRMGCHDGNTSWTMVPAIATSCNGYFGYCLVRILENKKYKSIQEAFEQWKNYMVSMGYGYKLGIDLPGETRGFIPNPAYYNNGFHTQNWKPINIISISIGQGEILATPLQIANLASTIANRGYYYVPHVLKEVYPSADGEIEQVPDTFLHPIYTKIDKRHYEVVAEGMRQAALMGTVRHAGNMDPEGIELCGKTGTAQNPHGRDHSVFMGFAPKDNPKIAVCCYIENGGFGATYGVPIGTLVIEKYLNGKISNRRKPFETRMFNESTLQYNKTYK
ncbi:MAG: penicillin-binding protein 2 [Bacteroidales bacterium]|nr:penicillin-binding protein 2 [Bacteroidales bacterium]MBP5763863.1 penicillin-binding protein 2 [Bacteroidales bacterium]